MGLDSNSNEPDEYDIIVVGSGAGAMLSAARASELGLSALIVEKSDKYGGTSAISGGAIWIPNNSQICEKDSYADAIAYLKAATRGLVAEDRLHAYLESAPQMVDYLMGSTELRYAACHRYPDSYQELPGAKAGGRTLDPEIFDATLLGNEFGNMREATSATLLMGKISMTAIQAHTLMAKESGWLMLIAWMILRYYFDIPWRWKTRRDRRLTLGSALIAGLRHALLIRKVPVWLNCPFESLIQEGGRVTGIVAQRRGESIKLVARRGVVLAAGGFERNQDMRNQYLPEPNNAAWSATPPHNTGDGLRAAMAIGARTDLMDWAWWLPTVNVPGRAAQHGLFIERALPGCIAVNGQGKRFVNEAAQYLEFCAAMYQDHSRTGATVPAWLIFDAGFRHKYPMGPLMPGQIVPDKRLCESWLGQVYWKDATLAGLARQIGVDPSGLAETVLLNNQYAINGVDLEFGKGNSIFDRYYGDSNIQPNPCLGSIEKAPFYAMRVNAGDIGTKGGLLTDRDARVLDQDGKPIEGLFCIGNNSSSVMGTTHPGAGGTLGPAMTFGFRAANFLARH